jgi:alpha-tubulin suppressor-like RCC1 family protein
MDDKKDEEKRKAKEDPFKIHEMIARGRGDTQGAYEFAPFTENDILTVESTKKSIFVLLKNGTVFSWKIVGLNGNKKFFDQQKSSKKIPVPLKFSVAVVDIVCGKEHCLAKGRNNKIYSWGSNAYGQLGLIGFPTYPNSEKGEPSEINALNVRIISSN